MSGIIFMVFLVGSSVPIVSLDIKFDQLSFVNHLRTGAKVFIQKLWSLKLTEDGPLEKYHVLSFIKSFWTFAF